MLNVIALGLDDFINDPFAMSERRTLSRGIPGWPFVLEKSFALQDVQDSIHKFCYLKHMSVFTLLACESAKSTSYDLV